MRILFFGTAAFAIPSLERLVARGHQVLLCMTQPDRPQGRGLKATPSPVKSAATRLHLPVAQPNELRELVPQLTSLQPEVGVVISYGRLIPPALLGLPRHGMLGVHPSLLPKYRGASPVAWAILNGDDTTGVTVFRLNEALDAGDILLQESESIEPQETAEQLLARLAQRGADLLLRSLERLERGEPMGTQQDERLATLAPKLTKAHGCINWEAGAASIDRLVRALNPWPGAYTTWRETLLKLWVTRVEPRPSTLRARPGEVLSSTPTGLRIATSDDIVVILELQPAGRRRMTVQDFVAGHMLRPGEILGEGQGAAPCPFVGDA